MKFTRNKEQPTTTDAIPKPEVQRGSRRGYIILGVGTVALGAVMLGSNVYKSSNSGVSKSESNPVPKVPAETPHTKKVIKPIPKKPSISPSIADVQKLEARYPIQQRANTIGRNCLIGLPGHMKRPTADYTADQRVQISLVNLKSAQISAARYKAFEPVDDSSTLSLTPPYNFNGLLNSEPLGEPGKLPGVVKNFVLELTTFSDQEYNWDGIKFAAAVTGLQKLSHTTYYLGYQNYTNKQSNGSSQTYHLSSTFTHSLPSTSLNRSAEVVETAGCEQASVEPIEYEHDIYTAAQFLIHNHYIAKGKAVTPVINATLKGQREIAPATPDGFSELIMDQVRTREVTLLHQLGYTG